MNFWWRLLAAGARTVPVGPGSGRAAVVAALLLGPTAAPARAQGPGPGFRDVAAEAGLVFRFHSGSRGKHDLPEIMGGGVALFDADGDGRLDVYLPDGGPIVPAPGLDDPPGRLFLQRGAWQFADVTATAGAPGPSYGLGTAVGDIDADGRDDLLVTGWRGQRLYRNLGGGRFADVTERAGLVDTGWSTSAAFADLDGDGDLDLYVGRYLDYDPKFSPFCAAPDGKRDYCGPEVFAAQPDRLYRNHGDGTFSDVSRAAGIDRPDETGRALGVLIADLTGDRRPDIFVANDGSPAFLFENRGNLTFAEVGQAAGVSRRGNGSALAGMGVALGDLDADGRDDLLVADFYGRGTVAFRSLGDGLYTDASGSFGLTAATRTVLGFGLALADLDADGRLDLLQANGHVLDRDRLGEPLALRPTLLQGVAGTPPLRDAAATAGPAFDSPIVGRGLALGDLDGDGRLDAVIAALDAPTLVLRNTSAGAGFVIDPVPAPPAVAPAVGARVTVTAGDRTQRRPVTAGGSYLATGARGVHFGLAGSDAPERVTIDWPSGRVESWDRPPIDAAHRLRLVEGTGRVVAP